MDNENARLRAADALAKAVLAVKRIKETQMRTADYHGEGCRCWRCKEDAMFAALDAYETAALTPAPEAPKGGEGLPGVMPRYFAVQSVTGVHIGMWENGKIASEVLSEYPGGKIIEMVDVHAVPRPTPASEGQE